MHLWLNKLYSSFFVYCQAILFTSIITKLTMIIIKKKNFLKHSHSTEKRNQANDHNTSDSNSTVFGISVHWSPDRPAVTSKSISEVVQLNWFPATRNTNP